MEIKITEDMLLAAVGTVAVRDGLQTLVTETIAATMADYFNRDSYGKTDFARTVSKFVNEIALEVLQGKRAEIEAAVSEEITRAIPHLQVLAARTVMGRINKVLDDGAKYG